MAGIPSFTWVRAASLALVAGSVALSTDLIAWISIVYSISFGHYIVGLAYSGKQIKRVTEDPGKFLPFIVILAAGACLYLLGLPLQYYFGVHHALNEAYAVNRVTRVDAREVRWLRAAGLFLHLFLFFSLIRDSHAVAWISRDVLFGGLAVSYLAYFRLLRRSRSLFSKEELINNSAFEIVGLLIFWASFHVRISVYHIALYHYLFWMFYPALGLRREGLRPLLAYAGLTLLVTGPFILWSPMGILADHFSMRAYHLHFLLQSYFHISISFALSSANPLWIRRVFEPPLSAAGAPAALGGLSPRIAAAPVEVGTVRDRIGPR